MNFTKIRMEIRFKDALKRQELRQSYLDDLIKNSGKNFPYVTAYKYISFNDMKKDPRKFLTFEERPEDLEKMTAAAIPESQEQRSNSTIYFTEANFSKLYERMIYQGYPQKDLESLQAIELTEHEAVHADHFANGIPILERLTLTDTPNRLLFLVTSEVIAHANHVKAIGKLNPYSTFPSAYQRFILGQFMLNMNALKQIAECSPELEPLAKKNI